MNIPYPLIDLSPWCLWEAIDRKNGKLGKRPINLSGYPIDVKKYPSGWSLHDTLSALESGIGNGLCVYLGNGLCAVDLDDCLNDQGVLTHKAQTIVKQFNTYTEISPSGKGLHLLFMTDPSFEPGVKNREGVEFHGGLKSLTVTCNFWGDEPLEVRHLSVEEVKYYFSMWFPSKSQSNSKSVFDFSQAPSDFDIVSMTAKDTIFTGLWNNATSHNDSDGDYVFCLKLLFYCGGDIDLVDACFRQSARMRDKWDEKRGGQTYGQLTIRNALQCWDGRCWQTPKSQDLPTYIQDSLDSSDLPKSQSAVSHDLPKSQPEVKNTVKNTGGESKDDSLKVSLPAQSTLAKSLAKLLSHTMAYDSVRADWMIYNGVYWSAVDCLHAYSLINQSVEERVTMGYSRTYLSGVTSFMEMHLNCANWNVVPGTVAFKNGLLNTSTRVLIPHDISHRTTWVIPYDYSESSDCGGIKSWLLESVGGHQDQFNLLRAYMAAILKGHSHLQRYLELIGPGGTGKGTFIRLCESLVGSENCHSTELSHLKGRFETANLYGKRLVTITDSENYAGDVSVLKALTGEDMLRYEEKNKQAGRGFKFQGMLIIAANEAISSKDYTSGIARRRVTVQFNHRVSTHQRRDLMAEFTPQLPALVNWLLDMSDEEIAHYVRDTHLSVSSLVDVAKENLLATNPIAKWLDDCVVYEPDSDVKTPVGNINKGPLGGILDWDTKLYPSYVVHCEASLVKPLSVTRFVPLLYELCVHQLDLKVQRVRLTAGSFFTNLRIKTEGDSSSSPLDVKYPPCTNS